MKKSKSYLIMETSNKLISFDSFYKFNEKWGTKKDWAKWLNNGDYNSTFIREYINTLIELNILITNRMITKQNKKYKTYKLHKNYIEKTYKEIIETQPSFFFYDELYKMTRKYVKKLFK